MKSQKNIIISILFIVAIIIAVAVFALLNSSDIDKVLGDENSQVEALIGIYNDMLNDINTDNSNVVLNESALKNILTNEKFSEENTKKIKNVEKDMENSQSTYTLYVTYLKDTYTLSIDVVKTGTGKMKITQKYKIEVENGKINYQRDGQGIMVQD